MEEARSRLNKRDKIVTNIIEFSWMLITSVLIYIFIYKVLRQGDSNLLITLGFIAMNVAITAVLDLYDIFILPHTWILRGRTKKYPSFETGVFDIDTNTAYSICNADDVSTELNKYMVNIPYGTFTAKNIKSISCGDKDLENKLNAILFVILLNLGEKVLKKKLLKSYKNKSIDEYEIMIEEIEKINPYTTVYAIKDIINFDSIILRNKYMQNQTFDCTWYFISKEEFSKSIWKK